MEGYQIYLDCSEYNLLLHHLLCVHGDGQVDTCMQTVQKDSEACVCLCGEEGGGEILLLFCPLCSAGSMRAQGLSEVQSRGVCC